MSVEHQHLCQLYARDRLEIEFIFLRINNPKYGFKAVFDESLMLIPSSN